MIFFDSPVFPIPPSFNEDSSIDLDTTEKYLSYLKSAGVKTIMTTAGTSQFNLLTEDEILLFNQLCVNYDGNVILGLSSSPNTLSTMNLLNIAENKKVSFLIFYPDRYYDYETIISYFKTIANKSPRPILIHTMPIRSGYGLYYVEYPTKLMLEISKIDNIIGMKEENRNKPHALDFCEKICNDNFGAIVAGGSISRYIYLKDAGAQTYLAGLGSVLPELEMEYWRTKDNKYLDLEQKLFSVFMKIGWHKALRTALKTKGFIKNDRQPFPQASETEIREIRYILSKLEKHI